MLNTILPTLISAMATVLVAYITITPQIKANRRKTEDLLESRLDTLEKSINNIKDKLNGHIKEDEENEQRARRVRILRFSDEIRCGKEHTQEHWTEILEDIDNYELYVKTHPLYQNNKGQVSMNTIKTTYQKLLQNNKFI